MKKIFEALFGGGGSGSITINGVSYSGRSVSITGNRVVIDGVVQDGELAGPISVAVTGNVAKLETTSGSVEVHGAVGKVNTMSGDVECGEVAGNVETMSGDVTCGKVQGSVKTMSGDIKGRAHL